MPRKTKSPDQFLFQYNTSNLIKTKPLLQLSPNTSTQQMFSGQYSNRNKNKQKFLDHKLSERLFIPTSLKDKVHLNRSQVSNSSKPYTEKT